MGEVLNFPKKSRDNSIREVVVDIACKMGLSDDLAEEVYMEYLPLHEEIFQDFSVKINHTALDELPEVQKNEMIEVMTSLVQQQLEFNHSKMMVAVNAVIGVLIREKLRQ
jgi:hypothetical protein